MVYPSLVRHQTIPAIFDILYLPSMKHFFSVVFIVFIVHLAQAQNEILMQVGPKKVTTAEFLRMYQKNNTPGTFTEVKNMDEYLQMFINYKLKVVEAESLGFDTINSFKSELAGYRKHLARPYLIDNNIIDKLTDEAYERIQYEIHVCHILISLDPHALPADTLKAYEKAIRIRKRALEGYDFKALARETSDDPSASRNSGDLGYITALRTVYQFENGAYKTPVGQISMPVRSPYGYHLIKVLDKRKARGEVKVAHITLLFPPNATMDELLEKEKQMLAIHKLLTEGADFGDLARKYSDDKSSAAQGGELPYFSTGRMVPEFENAAFDLNADGQFSPVFKSSIGYHIVKRIARKNMAEKSEIFQELKNKVIKDSRAELNKQAILARIKAETSFRDFGLLPEMNSLLDSAFFAGSDVPAEGADLTPVMFEFAGKKFTKQEFWNFLVISRPSRLNPEINISNYLSDQYTVYQESNLFDFEENNLEKKHPEFALTLQEYHDGLLLFELSKQKVWDKASNDTVGLKNFYEQNKSKYLAPGKRTLAVYQTYLYEVSKKMKKKLAKADNSIESVLAILSEYDPRARLLWSKDFVMEDSAQYKHIFARLDGGERFVLDATTHQFFHDRGVLGPQPIPLLEIRGQVTSDYQNKLELDWVAELRKKYQVQVNQLVYDKIKMNK